MSLVGIWPYYAFRDRCFLFVPMFTFSITILVPQVRDYKLYQITLAFPFMQHSSLFYIYIYIYIILHINLILYNIFFILRYILKYIKYNAFCNIDVAIVSSNHRDGSRRCIFMHSVDVDYNNIQLQIRVVDDKQQEST